MTVGETNKLLDIRYDGSRRALHGGDGIALSLQTHALTPAMEAKAGTPKHGIHRAFFAV